MSQDRAVANRPRVVKRHAQPEAALPTQDEIDQRRGYGRDDLERAARDPTYLPELERKARAHSHNDKITPACETPGTDLPPPTGKNYGPGGCLTEEAEQRRRTRAHQGNVATRQRCQRDCLPNFDWCNQRVDTPGLGERFTHSSRNAAEACASELNSCRAQCDSQFQKDEVDAQ
jgi:hypothetical protein